MRCERSSERAKRPTLRDTVDASTAEFQAPARRVVGNTAGSGVYLSLVRVFAPLPGTGVMSSLFPSPGTTVRLPRQTW